MSATPQYLSVSTGTGSTATWAAGAELHTIEIGTATASAVVTVYNGTTAAGEVKAIIDAATLRSCRFHGARFPLGLFVVQSGANAKVTVTAE